ncbi:N-acetylglucosamine-6-phosphate deacetylase [Paenibacillus polymyxa]|uniref:N-acetylglucosamine-6-phosphate deacetylase n=1 Tax=Paenibacillus polymyxa TaxID=1406 RepID=A0A378Y2L8_PAEPO|nr:MULTISPECIES: N-acetylglucosamine-6-phosphate deacetylase [Paenibacillus]KAF6617786.1 N-acetylglucosamine-6-phosphate deacetylase [Paenibacillus sp. EKM101P]KAF6618595.1 N-acetylglucosamine-6-phosphate deacetylase [Paenibacillus sp. EKM102P]KAF6626919.1 N-acetylglucosamine-6-phosphate deacetylase [Paenibacillus sp. EKM10P]KAF6646342.1 N-acetylglucosamine-6-phosphate deacetylase [Paenibacillus sp. EKM11P]MBE7898557.1 N-acetylglucosamine-6-phosphate deacetylase [Paenibacillus polymyxa]
MKSDELNGNIPQLLYGQVVVGNDIIDNGVVIIEGQSIVYVGSEEDLPVDWTSVVLGNPEEGATQAANIVRLEGGYLLPGFIDIHVHGGNGEDFMDSDSRVLDAITSFHSSQGTTAMLATTMTAPKERIDRVLKEVHTYMALPMPHAQLEGVHLEGPFISPNWAGAQNPEHIVPPNLAWVAEWEQCYPGLVRQVTLAPERKGALELITWLRSHGITAALGHTNATYEEIEQAASAGLNHAVHTFNAMTPLHHRKPGAAGAVLVDPRIEAEIIADGIHVHPAAISLLAKLKQDHNLILITDAMSATGLEDGHYTLGDLPVIVQDGVARLEDGVTLAGSTLTMIEGFRYLVQQVGLSIPEASQMASLNPARSLNIADRTGSLEAGKQADILLLDADLNLQGIWIKGVRKSL